MNIKSQLLLFSLLLLAVHLSAQIKIPQVGETLYAYSLHMDIPVSDLNELDFYSMDFHCMSKRGLRPSELPRTDYEIYDENDFSEVYAIQDNKLVLKGFKMADPFISNSSKFIQLISGIPLLNLDNIRDCKHNGDQNIYLEYKVEELPDQVSLWAELNSYSKLRLKVNIHYKSSYVGKASFDFAGYNSYYKVNTSYAFEVVELQMKKDDWELIDLETFPGREEYLQLAKVAFSSYYNGATQYPFLRCYDNPNLKAEFHFNELVLDLPICSPQTSQVYVYPNPTLGDLNIRMLDLDPDIYTFALYNIIGIKVWETQLKNGEQDLFRLRLPDLDKGVYLYSIKNMRGRYIQSRRLTVLEH